MRSIKLWKKDVILVIVKMIVNDEGWIDSGPQGYNLDDKPVELKLLIW